MTAKEVMAELESYGNPQTKKTLMKHGAVEPVFGVKVADLKKILKKTKKNHELSLELYKTGNSDAMYLAGLIADEKQITKPQIQEWVKGAYWHYLSEYTVPWVASETDFGFEIGNEWIDSADEKIASAGWATLASHAAITDDEHLDIEAYSALLDRAAKDLHKAQNREKYTRNGFIIAIASYISPLMEKAQQKAAEVGKVSVDMNGTACKVPVAKDYILNLIDKGRVGKKRKSARC